MFFDAWTRVGVRPKSHPKHPWTLAHLVDELAHCSISGALVASSQVNYDCMYENRRLSAALAPHDHLFPVWDVLPHWTGECPAPAALTAELERYGVRAVSVQPKTHNFVLLSETTHPLLAELERTATLTILPFDEVDARDWEPLLARYPRLPLLLRNVWWNNQRIVLPLLVRHPNLHVMFDAFQIHRGIEWLVAHGCEKQVLYGSRAPEMAAGCHRAYIDWAEIPEAAKDLAAGGNLVRLLKGQRPPRLVDNPHDDAVMAATRRGEPLPGLVLDMHAHILDEGMNGAGGGNVMLEGGPNGVRHQAERLGVKGIGVMSWHGTVGADAADGNRTVKAALDAHPDYFWGLGTFDVVHDSAETMRRQMAELYADKRFLGLKPYPSYGPSYDDPRYDCWWEFGNQRRLYCGLHLTKWGKPDEVDSIAKRFPELTVVIYHCGASYEFADMVIGACQRWPNVMVEPTLTPCCCGIIDHLVAGCGADRVMYGSDLPMRDPRQQLGWIVFSRLPIDVKWQVLGGNAQRLLQRIRG
jgi:hypothetical protein